ncbi:glycosyltransferase family protein [uncultured Enterovirga sp.]|uniref:glycosyltransferase family protein n=1 Tax=uncultured Enterovirga sp. TaxID=2026352 RepID=UPI0035CC5870
MSLRILIVVTHLLGAGHLTRAAAIARAAAAQGHRPTLVTGGAPSPLVDVAGVEVVQLPPVRTPLGDFTSLRDLAGRPVGPELLASRREILLRTVAAVRPDVVVTELFPFGRRVLAPEFRALIGAVEAAPDRPILACSIRDILAAPSRPEKAAATHDLLRRHYDAVLVHGEAALIPLEASWPVDADLRERLTYTGYIGPDAWSESEAPSPRDDETILVSGGSSAAALPLYRAALGAAAERGNLRWHILVGAGVDEAGHQDLVRRAPSNATVERSRSDFRDLLRKSAVFVGQAGYNTVMDIVATQPRAVLVPFEQAGETEQKRRATALAERGLVTLLAESKLDSGILRRGVEAALARPRPVFPPIRLDGASATVACIERLARSGARRRATGAAA